MENASFCYKTASIWQLVGYGFFIIKIVVPLIIVIMGIIAFAQAIMASDDKAISKAGVSLIKKLIIGIVIFLFPTILNAIFSMLPLFTNSKGDFDVCFNCVTMPTSKCDTSYKGEVIPIDE